MSRFSLFLAVTFLLLILAVYQLHERISLAFALIGTFVLFPRSHINILTIPEQSITKNLETFQPLQNDDTLAVPAIVHQVLLGDLQMRPTWEEARTSCQELHPTWEFYLWRDQDANAFVEQSYPQLYETYRGYHLEIQRSNVLRYLLLHHYGGMYFDLDLRCRQPLDFLRNETFLTPPANPTGINNAFIVSVKSHPFWQHVIDNLPRYDLNWYSPYLTNMFSTGCHFLSTMHRTYPDQYHLQILESVHKLNGHVVTPLFEHLGASSWHKGDAKLILSLGLVVEKVKQSSKFIQRSGKIILAILVLTALILIRRRQQLKKKSNWWGADLESRKEDVE